MAQITLLVTDGKHGDCEDEEGSGYFFLSSRDLRDGKLHYDKPRQITKSGFLETHRRTNLEPGDILLANCGASIGRVGLAQDDPRICKTTFQKSVSVIKANKSIIDNRFLYYFICHKSALLIRLGNGAAQPNLLIGDLKRIEVPVPPLPLQQRIAGILSAYDELIENSQRRIKILESMARALYREWFVHFRFPGHESVPRVPSPLGEIPKGWEIKMFGQIYNTCSGGTPSRKHPEYFESGIIDWVKSQELLDRFILSTEEQITAEAIANSSAKVLPPNTVLVALYGATIGMLAITSRSAATNQACCAVLPKLQGFCREFAFLTLLTNRQRIIGLRLGAAQQNISQVLLRNFECIVPPTTIAAEFADRVSPLFDGILAYQQQIQNLRRTRDLLLPRLLSGQIDVEAIAS
jgi:type I restriction enzyme S subunit